MIDTQTLCVGFAYDSKTRDWTQRVEYVARDESEARNWLRFNRDWLKDAHIEPQHDSHVVLRLSLMD